MDYKEEYKFNDNKEETLVEHPENVPFPDIPAEELQDTDQMRGDSRGECHSRGACTEQ
jgi:hypothetical protein